MQPEGAQAQMPGSHSACQPPVARLHPCVTALHCSLTPCEALALAGAEEQLRWWHRLYAALEKELRQFGAVTAQRDEAGVCGVLGLVEGGGQPADTKHALSAVHCAVALLDAIRVVRALAVPCNLWPHGQGDLPDMLHVASYTCAVLHVTDRAMLSTFMQGQ